MKLVVVTDNRFWRQKLGSHQRIYALLQYLSKQFTINIYFAGKPTENDENDVKNLSFDVEFSSTISHKTRSNKDSIYNVINWCVLVKNKIHRVINKHLFKEENTFVPSLCHHFKLDEIQKFRTYLLQHNPDVILFEYTKLSYLQKSMLTNDKVTVLDTHDVGYLRYFQFIKNKSNSGLKISQKEEKRVLSSFNYVLAIQLEDQENYEKIGLNNILYVPHAVPYKNTSTPSLDTFNIGFIGSTMQSNIDGIQWFIDKVLPELKDHIRVIVAGAVCSKITSSDERIILLGYVDSLDDYYQEIHLSINPIFYGSGLKIKSVESICHGKPIITTEIGVEGMPKISNNPFRVCNTLTDWVESISYIKSNEAYQKLTNACEEYALKHYSNEVAYSELSKSLYCNNKYA